MTLTVEPLNERRKRWRACPHPDMFFGSGGHFVWCAKCGAEWTASFDGGKYDDNRAGSILDTSIHRIIAEYDAPSTAPYSWGTDYGKDLLTDINQMTHRGGTSALLQDCLKRAYREISRLRKSLQRSP